MKYNLLLVRNRCKDKVNLTKGLEWFKKNTPLDVVMVDEISTDFDVTTTEISNATFKGVMCGEDIIPKLRTVVPEGKYHAVVFIYGNKLNGIRVNVAPVMPIYPTTHLIQLIKLNDNGVTLNHEIFHTFFHKVRQSVAIEDPMDSVVYNGQVKPYFNNANLDAKPSNRSIALGRLAPYWDKVVNTKTMPTYKYFKESEVKGLKPEFVQLLDKARGISGVPFRITSGLRSPSHNESVGGVPDSSHLTGLAVDLAVADGVTGGKILLALVQVGFKRFGFYKDGHLHVDLDNSKPNPCYWIK